MFCGIQKGLIRELFGLLSIVIGFIVAMWFGKTLAIELERFISSSQGALILSYALLFVSVSLTINYLATLLTRLSKALALSLMNRFLGGLFGLAKALLVIVFLSYLISLITQEFAIDLPDYLSGSLILNSANNILGLFFS